MPSNPYHIIFTFLVFPLVFSCSSELNPEQEPEF